jgi:hypothetical protein
MQLLSESLASSSRRCGALSPSSEASGLDEVETTLRPPKSDQVA